MTCRPKRSKKIQTLAQIADDLRHGKTFNITRLTLLKSSFSDPDATARFALYLAKKTQKAMRARGCPRYTKPEDWQEYRRLVGKVVREMTQYLKKRTTEADLKLRDLFSEVRGVQNEYKHRRGGTIRIIHSRDVLVAEKALECVLYPMYGSLRGYDLAREYTERYNAHYGTGLIPDSAPMMEDIAEFWGRHFLGPGWRKKLPNQPPRGWS